MKYLLDTCVLVALVDHVDQHHQNAKMQLFQLLEKDKNAEFFVLVSQINELVFVLKKKKGWKWEKIKEALKQISDSVNVICIDWKTVLESINILRQEKSQNFGHFVDTLILLTALKENFLVWTFDQRLKKKLEKLNLSLY